VSEQTMRLGGLQATNTLRLLAEFLEYDAANLEFLQEVNLVIDTMVASDGSHDVEITLIFNAASQPSQADDFITRYNRLTGLTPTTGVSPVDEVSYPLLSAFPCLLQVLAPEDAVSGTRRSVRPLSDYKMLVGSQISEDRALTILQDLQRYGTATQVSVADHREGSYYLFLVRDDASRNSGFAGAVTAGFFDDCILLNGYRVTHKQKDYLLFLSPEYQPTSTALHYFARFIAAMPFKRTEAVDNEIVLALVFAQLMTNGNAPPQILYTRSLCFYEAFRLVPPFRVRSFETLTLADSSVQLENLRALAAKTQPRRGYRLRLREAHYHEPNEELYENLLQELQQIEEELMELESLRVKRPQLYRFTQRQLPILVEKIASYPPNQLKHLLYAFHADESKFPEGVHYLLVRPEVEMSDLDPLIWWGDNPEQPMRFWPDPLWSLYYDKHGNQSQVFVPYNSVLHPPFHSWEVAGMDAFLQEIFRDDRPQPDIAPSDNLIYVFTGVPERDADLDVVMLRSTDFVPINTPKNIGWINDHLTILSRVDLETFIEGLSNSVSRAALAETLLRDASKAEKALERAVLKSRDSMSDKTQALVDEIGNELDRLIAEAKQLVTDGNLVNQRIASLRTLYLSVASAVDQTETQAASVDKKQQAVSQRIRELAHSVESAIKAAQQAQEDFLLQMQAEVEQLKRTRDRLEQRLRALQLSLWGPE